MSLKNKRSLFVFFLWLVRTPPDRAVRVRALTGGSVMFSWARHFALTVPLFTQIYKCVPVNLMLEGPKYSYSLCATEPEIRSGLMGD